MMRACRRCGEEFYADVEWKRLCLDCWKAARNNEETAQERIRRLEMEVERLRRSAPSQGVSIPQDLVRVMIQLCHPDKHGGKESAVRVTQWLLGQRAR